MRIVVSKLSSLLAPVTAVLLMASPPALLAQDAAAHLALPPPPPLTINLAHFEHVKHHVRLPNGEDMAYVDMGNAHGAPVVLIHGYTDSARDWVPLIPFLDKDRRLLVIDIRGHGLSDKPDCCYTRFDFAYDVKLLLDTLHIEHADIVGHSLGSIIAQTFAELWPERARSVTLIASTAQSPHFDFSPIRQLREPIDPESPFMKAWWSSPNPVDPDLLRLARNDSARIPVRVWWAILDQAISDDSLRAMLNRITAPTLLIWGSEDFIMKPEDRQSLIDALPKAQVHIFKGLGHNPFWEVPVAVARVVNAFIKDPAARLPAGD